MRITINLSTALAAVALAALLLPATVKRAEAQVPGRHPAYIHALSDLRLARAYLDRLTPSEHLDAEQEHAIHEIDAAIGDIKHAAIDDGKNPYDHAPIDAHIQPRNRFGKAREALHAALNDVNREEDDPHTRGLQHRSVDHIEKALDTVHKIEIRLGF